MKRFQLLILTAIRVVVNTAQRMIYPFLAVFARGLGVDVGIISTLVVNRAIVGALDPFIFPFIEPRGRKFGMLLGMSLFIFSMGLVVFWPTTISLGISLILSFAGKSIFDPSLTSYVADHTPYEKRGSAIALLEFAWSLAFILGIPFVGWLISLSNWSMPFSVLAILGAVSFIYIAISLRDSTKPEHHASGVFGNARIILTSRTTLIALTIGLSVSAANEVVNLIFGVWLEDSFKLQIAALSAASAVIGFSELSGEGLVFWFVDRIGKVRASGIGIIANCAAAILLPIIGHTQLGALIGLFFFYFTFEFTIVSIIPLMTEIMPSARATTLSFAGAGHSLGRAIGALLAPVLYTRGFTFITGTAIIFNLLGLAAVWYVGKHHE